MRNGLFMFMGSSDSLREEDIDIILDYKVSNVVCILYGYSESMLDSLEEQLRDKVEKIDYILADNPNDRSVDTRIRNLIAEEPDRIYFDVTYASSFHAATVMNLGGSDGMQIWSSAFDGDGKISRERIDRIRNDYNGLSPTCYLILDLMTKIKDVNAQTVESSLMQNQDKDPAKSRKKTSIHKELERMVAWNLIDRSSEGVVSEEYKSRTQHFYTMRLDQRQDYFVYKSNDSMHRANFEDVRRRKSLAVQSKKETKRLGQERRRTNPRKKSQQSVSPDGIFRSRTPIPHGLGNPSC